MTFFWFLNLKWVEKGSGPRPRSGGHSPQAPSAATGRTCQGQLPSAQGVCLERVTGKEENKDVITWRNAKLGSSHDYIMEKVLCPGKDLGPFHVNLIILIPADMSIAPFIKCIRKQAQRGYLTWTWSQSWQVLKLRSGLIPVSAQTPWPYCLPLRCHSNAPKDWVHLRVSSFCCYETLLEKNRNLPLSTNSLLFQFSFGE